MNGTRCNRAVAGSETLAQESGQIKNLISVKHKLNKCSKLADLKSSTKFDLKSLQ